MRNVVLLPLLAACGAESIDLTITDGLSGAPMPELRVTAEAADEVPFSCQFAEGTTDNAGHVVLPGPCISKSTYNVSVSEEALWLADGSTVAMGMTGPVTLKVYRAPRGSGMYVLADGALTSLPTHADVKHAAIWGSTEQVDYPGRLPTEDAVPRVGPGTWLVLTGEDNLAGATLTPLVRSGPRKFGTEDQWTEMQDWWYLGTAFTSDSEFTRQAVALDATKVVERTGSRAVRYIPSDALPEGRYALKSADSRRMTVIDFGNPPAVAPLAGGDAPETASPPVP